MKEQQKKCKRFEEKGNELLNEKLTAEDIKIQENIIKEELKKPAEIDKNKLKKIKNTRKTIQKNTGGCNAFLEDYFKKEKSVFNNNNLDNNKNLNSNDLDGNDNYIP